MSESGPKFDSGGEQPKRKVNFKRFKLLSEIAGLRKKSFELIPGSSDEKSLNKKLTKLEVELGDFRQMEDDLDALKAGELESEEETEISAIGGEPDGTVPAKGSFEGGQTRRRKPAPPKKTSVEDRAVAVLANLEDIAKERGLHGKIAADSEISIGASAPSRAESLDLIEHREKELHRRERKGDDLITPEEVFMRGVELMQRGYPDDVTAEEMKIIYTRSLEIPSDSTWDEIRREEMRKHGKAAISRRIKEMFGKKSEAPAKRYWIDKLNLKKNASWEEIRMAAGRDFSIVLKPEDQQENTEKKIE